MAQRQEINERFWLHYRLGLSLQRLNQNQDALLHYGVCQGLRPRFAWIPFNIALVQLKLNRKTMARNSLERTIYLDPQLTPAYEALVSMQFQSREFEAAIETCEQAESNSSLNDTLIAMKEESLRLLRGK